MSAASGEPPGAETRIVVDTDLIEYSLPDTRDNDGDYTIRFARYGYPQLTNYILSVDTVVKIELTRVTLVYYDTAEDRQGTRHESHFDSMLFVERVVKTGDMGLDETHSGLTLGTFLSKAIGIEDWLALEERLGKQLGQKPLTGYMAIAKRAPIYITIRNPDNTKRVKLDNPFETYLEHTKDALVFEFGRQARLRTRVCPIPHTTLNEKGTCWADSAIFLLFYPKSVREHVVKVLDRLPRQNNEELHAFKDRLVSLYTTSRLGNEECQIISNAEQFFELLNKANGNEIPILYEEYYPGGYAEWIFDIMTELSERTGLYNIAQLRKFPSDEEGGAVSFKHYAIPSSSAYPLPDLIIAKRGDANDKVPTMMFFNENDPFSHNLVHSYVLRGVLLTTQEHELAVASCDHVLETFRNTNWYVHDGLRGNFFAHGTWEIVRPMIMGGAQEPGSFGITYGNENLPSITNAEDVFLYVKKHTSRG